MTSLAAHTPGRQTSTPATQLVAKARWRWPESLLWLFAIALIWIAPSRYLLFNEIAILALLALVDRSCPRVCRDRYARAGRLLSVSAPMSPGLMAKHGMGTFPWSDPLLGLLGAALVAGLLGFLSSFLVLRGSDLTRLMVTLGIALIVQELGNRLDWITGGADGLQGVSARAGPRPVRFRYLWPHRVSLFAERAVRAVSAGARAGEFALRPVAARHQRQCDARARASAFPSSAGLSSSTRSAPPMPGLPARCWRKRRSLSRSTCSPSKVGRCAC